MKEKKENGVRNEQSIRWRKVKKKDEKEENGRRENDLHWEWKKQFKSN